MPKGTGILTLLHALYGLLPSRLLWQRELIVTLNNNGLYPVPNVNCLFHGKDIWILFYVDDIVAMARNKQILIDFQTIIMSKYKIKILSDIHQFLGIHIIRERSTRHL